MTKIKTIGIDLDDCVADYWGAAGDPITKKVREHLMWDKDFFLNLRPLPGAQGAIFDLQKLGFDLYIVSQPLAESPESYTEKAKWVQLHFPQLYKKIILTQDKGLIKLDYLIDDNSDKWKSKFEQGGGKFIHFEYGGYNYGEYPHLCPDPQKSWRKIVEFFSKQS